MMGTGEDAFAHALCRTACLQLIYAQAESRNATAAAKAAASPTKPPPKPSARPPVSPDAVYIVDSAADTLADVLAAFLYQVGRASVSRTRLSGRTIVSLADAESALQAMAPATQSSLRDIARYASCQRIAFPRRVPPFPVLPPPRTTPTPAPPPAPVPPAAERNRPYIEDWMPALPPPHTFVATPGELAAVPGPARGVTTPAQRRRVEASLAALRASGKRKAPSAGTGLARRAQPLRPVVPGNPFFAPPVLYGAESAAPPREVRVEDAPPAPPAITESSSKATVSDVKRMRVERILAESGGTTGVPPGSGGGPATPANVSTPIPVTPAPHTPAPDGMNSIGPGSDVL